MDGKYVTPILETPRSSRSVCQSQGFADCIQFPLHRLQLEDSELGRACLFELYVYNSAGHFTTVRTNSILLPSRFPPGPATVVDLNPASADSLKDVDFHQNRSACVHWYGFHHHRHVTLEMGIGSDKGLDDVQSFTLVSNTSDPVHCLTSAHLKPFTRYFTSVRASCSGGVSVSSSDGFVIVEDIADAMSVNDGSGCDPVENYILEHANLSLTSGNESSLSFESPLQVGFSYSIVVKSNGSLKDMMFTSDDIYKQKDNIHISSYAVTFFPLSTKPVFQISSPSSLDVNLQILSCLKDIDYTSSTTTYSINWDVTGPYSRFITHYQVDLLEKSCNESSSGSCFNTIAHSKIQATGNTTFTFTGLQLQPDVNYIGSVSPCFEHVCRSREVSGGVWVTRKPVIQNIASEMRDETRDCTTISLKVSDIDCGQPAENRNASYVIMSAILKSESDVSPVTPWTKVAVTENTEVNIAAFCEYFVIKICATNVKCI